MNAKVKALWVADLRKNAHRQGKGALSHRNGRRFFDCCLGRLCRLAVKAGVIGKPEILPSGAALFADRLAELPEAVIDWAGLDSEDPRLEIKGTRGYASVHNDDGATFLEIADAIEEQL